MFLRGRLLRPSAGVRLRPMRCCIRPGTPSRTSVQRRWPATRQDETGSAIATFDEFLMTWCSPTRSRLTFAPPPCFHTGRPCSLSSRQAPTSFPRCAPARETGPRRRTKRLPSSKATPAGEKALFLADACGTFTRSVGATTESTAIGDTNRTAGARTARSILRRGTSARFGGKVVAWRSSAGVLSLKKVTSIEPTGVWTVAAGDSRPIGRTVTLGNKVEIDQYCTHASQTVAGAQGPLVFGYSTANANICPGADGQLILTEGTSVRTRLADPTMIWHLRDGRTISLRRPSGRRPTVDDSSSSPVRPAG